AGSWTLTFIPGTGFVLTELETGLRVTASPTLTIAAPATSGQGWRLSQTKVTLTGLYELAPASATGLRLDVYGGKTDSKANVQVYNSNSSLAQSWALCEVGSSSYFNILSRKSGLALDIAGASSESGSNVWQYTANGTPAQEWALVMGRYGIGFASSLGTMLTADASSSGSNASATTDASAPAQCWLLKSVAAPSSTYLVAIDPGHGGADSGATGNGLVESNLTWRIALAMRSSLVSSGVNVYLTRSQNENVSIKDRVARAYAQGAVVIVSIHVDSSGSSSAHGASALTPNNSSYNRSLHTQGRTLGGLILGNIKALGITSRGYLERNYSIADGADTNEYYPGGGYQDYYGIVRYARQRGMLGIIIEHGFITNPGDASKLSNSSFLTRLGEADAAGVISMYGTGASDNSTSSNGSTTLGTAIMGTSRTTVAQMVRYFNSMGYSYPSSVYSGKGAPTITDFCQIIYEEAAAEGVRAEVVFAQAMLETGWLQFGGDVSASQCNFCGLGATGGVPGASFSNVTIGVRAQVQHLKAYASTAPLNQACVDPRFSLVTRGCATTVEGLTGKWAMSSTYGDNVVAITKRLLATS
ncbi:MAG: N-acetylmuramoyl-L-alanine amidase, partial [Atopobiaceae bacterium]|nr:N-acetylmuramoyl-L-alanine amidase [Atopobiaceae bacterium]